MVERGITGGLKGETSHVGFVLAHVSRNPIDPERHILRETFWLAIGLVIFALIHMFGASVLSASLGKRVLVPITFVPASD
jgi:hypothetical protein